MHTRSKRNPIVSLVGSRNEILLFLINKTQTENVAMAAKLFTINAPLSSLISVPSFT